MHILYSSTTELLYLADMPSGEVTLHLYINETIVCSTNVTYYTEMEEISNYLEKVMDPVHFMCQVIPSVYSFCLLR